MDSDGSDPFFDEEESYSSEDEDVEDNDEYWFNTNLQGIRENNPRTTELNGDANNETIQNMTDEEWEELGRDISNNTHLGSVDLSESGLNDHKMSFLFRGLTRSNSIKEIALYENRFSVAGVRSMTPFLQNANELMHIDLDDNNIRSEGFTFLVRALRDSPIEILCCNRCGIDSIEIDSDYFPTQLTSLFLYGNSINVDGCRGLAKLLQGADATLAHLRLGKNQIHDEGVAILMNALQSNTSLKHLDLSENGGISVEGMRLCLQLVNDISTIKATLQSNHTLQTLHFKYIHYYDDGVNERIQMQIDNAVRINKNHRNDPEAAGKKKLQIQLGSEMRAELAELQGVDRSLYSEINPLHLPEVLALVGRHHGQGELYVALKSSIAGVISTVNRKECIHQRMASDAARLVVLDAELAAIYEAEGDTEDIGSENHSNKRSRV